MYRPARVGRYTGVDGVQYLAGRYRLIERLGAGGMSVVWRAYDDVLHRRVAVKLLGPRFAEDPASRERIRAEARAAARLNHPCITDVYDYGESPVDNGTVPFVVMELVEGVPLDARLRGGPLPWRFAAEVCAQVAGALAAVHERGLVHRDVKPANIMLTGSGAKVVDFGISAVAGDRSERPGQVFGTPAYLAPERLDALPADAASDVYALGLVLYKALSGDLPWAAETTTQILKAHCYVEPAPLPPVPGLPAAVVEVCRRSLAKDPGDRPAAAELAATLRAAASTVAPVEAPVSPAPSTPDATTRTGLSGVISRSWPGGAQAGLRTAGPRPRTLRLAAVAVVAAVIAVSAVAWARDDPGGRSTVAAGAGEPETVAESGCRVEYRTTVDTGGQFQVNLTIANTGGAPLPQWVLAFRYPGDQRLSSVVGAVSTQDGADVALAGQEPLPSGAAATVSLVGTYTAGNPMPTVFELEGQPCDGQWVGAAAPPPVPVTEPAVTGEQGVRADNGSGSGAGSGSGSNSGPGSGSRPGKPGKGKKGKG